MNQLNIKRIYLDNSLLVGWFLPYLQDIKNPKTPKIIEFLSMHREIEVFISFFTIAELVEDLMFKEPRVKDYRKNMNNVLDLIDILTESLKIKRIIHKDKNELEGNFIPKNIVEFTSICGSLKDSVHVSIAKYQDLYFVTHDKKITLLGSAYDKIITDNKLYKLFDY